MMELIKTFNVDSAIYFECEYRDQNGELADPTSPTWEIKNGVGTVVADSSTAGGPYKRVTGCWYLLWTPSLVGDYSLEFSGTIDTYAVNIKRPFKVVNYITHY
jgi:hypothetical protein